MSTDVSRVEVLEEVVDAATQFVAFLAADRIEKKETIEYLVDRIGDLEEHEIVAVERQPASSPSSTPDIETVIAERDAAQKNVEILNQAVKDHGKASQVAKRSLRDAERENARILRLAAEKEQSLAAEVNELRALINEQNTEIENLRNQPPADAAFAELVRELEADTKKLKADNAQLFEAQVKAAGHLQRAIGLWEKDDKSFRALRSAVNLLPKVS